MIYPFCTSFVVSAISVFCLQIVFGRIVFEVQVFRKLKSDWIKALATLFQEYKYCVATPYLCRGLL